MANEPGSGVDHFKERSENTHEQWEQLFSEGGEFSPENLEKLQEIVRTIDNDVFEINSDFENLQHSIDDERGRNLPSSDRIIEARAELLRKIEAFKTKICS